MRKLLILSLGLTVLAFLGACSTVNSRIKEKSDVYNTLTPQEQANIQQGVIDIGYSMDMVYMAMGKADNVKEKITPAGTVTTWIYNMYYQDYLGNRFVGYRRNMYYDSNARVWRVYYTPVSEPVYRDRIEEVGRVNFKNGKVSSIEESK